MQVVNVVRTKRQLWWFLAVMAVVTVEVVSLNGANVCVVQQKYNITKRVKYRAPMSVRTYVWCLSMPPRCTKWTTEMRDLTKLETEERTAEVSVCCPGYKMKEVSCVPICPNGKTGPGCSKDCPANKWGPNCVNDCHECSDHGSCSPITGECLCQHGWQGERCQMSMATTTTTIGPVLTTKFATKPPTPPTEITTKTTIPTIPSTTPTTTSTTILTTIPTVVSSTTQTSKAPSTLSTVPSTTISIVPVTARAPVTMYSTTRALEQETTHKGNTTLTTPWTVTAYKSVTAETGPKYYLTDSVYNRTEIPAQTTRATIVNAHSTTVKATEVLSTTNRKTTLTEGFKITTEATKVTTNKLETTKKQDSFVKIIPTTIKMKPKEIWIKPAQKGELSNVESKVKISSETLNSKHNSATREEPTSVVTTPRTIIVSIIPTSVSYTTFKKISLTTATSQKQNVTRSNNNWEIGSTKSSPPSISASIEKTLNSSNKPSLMNTTINPLVLRNVTKTKSITISTVLTSSVPPTENVTFKSMPSMTNEAKTKLNMTDFLATTALPSANTFQTMKTSNRLHEGMPTNRTTPLLAQLTTKSVFITTEHPYTTKPTTNEQPVTITQRNDTKPDRVNPKVIKSNSNISQSKEIDSTVLKKNVANNNTNVLTTEDPRRDEETFHILTEPEHITAVMGEKGTERSSLDLLSVISIAGGLMMTVITIAVVIVMFERCKRSSYDDVRKLNGMRMQVLIDNNDVPPPYVRSIYHTPLPDPPTSDKVHYQPISTLNRNLKQFMRPVVVQTISPIMLENFRDIFECHYDHLPKRSHEHCGAEIRCSVTPSMSCCEELRSQRTSVADSCIEDLKCEVKLDNDLLDSTTSEPLYAEIPCWRTSSEIPNVTVNENGEAVTEL